MHEIFVHLKQPQASEETSTMNDPNRMDPSMSSGMGSGKSSSGMMGKMNQMFSSTKDTFTKGVDKMKGMFASKSNR
jgi:hypothetical protein